MKIGYVNIYAFRPHVEHLVYLAELMESAGHESYFLTCDAAVDVCYARSLKGTGKLKECTKCIAGGVRSFPVSRITSIRKSVQKIDGVLLDKLALSSSCTLNRTESELEWNEDEVIKTRKEMFSSITSVLENAKKWISSNNLDAVICFNGRMDLTRAVTYACEELSVPFVTHERTWFGDGITLVPNENCLALKAQNKIVSEFENKPLTKEQARFAGKMAGERFLQKNSLEWRLYNRNPEPAEWPLNTTGKRILVLPSSKNEFAGHDDWINSWQDNTSALDDFLDVFGFSSKQVVVRCHPNWSENIGRIKGDRSLDHYKKWASKRGVYIIGSEEKASTYDLIQQADIVVMNGGSSAVEAGVCGKQVVCLGSATYEKAGFVHVFKSRRDMEAVESVLALNPDDIIRKTLRFMYVRSHRFPQFVDFVKAVETTKYKYFEGADPRRIEHMIHTGDVLPDDASFSDNHIAEDEVLDLLRKKEWAELASYESIKPRLNELVIKRRPTLRWLDSFRNMFARGDR